MSENTGMTIPEILLLVADFAEAHPATPDHRDFERRLRNLDSAAIRAQVKALVDAEAQAKGVNQSIRTLLHDIRHHPELPNGIMETYVLFQLAQLQQTLASNGPEAPDA